MFFHELEPMNIAEIGRAWEGRMVDARLPLRQWLGSSDHSCVYLTEIAGPQSPKVVVKILPADFFNLGPQLARWRALAQLSSPSLLRLLDGGRSEIDGTSFFFVVMDFADEDLAQILPQRALTTDEVKELLPPVLEGLAYLHKSGFVHGHIQPSNIMASGDKLKLPVERIYAIGEPRDKSSPPGPYDAPEVANAAMTPAADVWSLGMFLIAALKQRPLALPANPTSAPVIPADIAEPLRSIISDCLALNPKDRCTITEIGAWLQPAPPISAPTPKPSSPSKVAAPKPTVKSAPPQASSPVRIVEASPAPTRSRRSGWRVGAPVAVVVLIVLIAALLLGRQLLSHKPEPAAPPTIATTETKPAAAAAPEPSPPEDPIRHRIVPEISANTKRKIHGVIKVSVHVDVDQSGKVIAANIVSPSSSQYFNNLSQETAEQWEFSPAENNGTPVQSAWLLRFQFSRRSTQVVPSRIAHP
jgi:TonB family protein